MVVGNEDVTIYMLRLNIKYVCVLLPINMEYDYKNCSSIWILRVRVSKYINMLPANHLQYVKSLQLGHGSDIGGLDEIFEFLDLFL